MTVVSTQKEDPVNSFPVGRIDYLHTDGIVRESIEYTSEYQFVKDIKDENYYGVPMKIYVYLLVRNGTGTAYFDGVQLEKGRVPSEYNLLENNGFDYAENTTSNTGNSWIRKNLSTEDGISNGKFVVNGNVTAKKYFYQEVPVTEADQDNKYVLKVVAKGSSIPLSKSAFAVRLRTFYEDGTYSNSNSTTQFNVYNHEEQYLQVGYSIPASATGSKAVKIRIYFLYFYNINQTEIETMNFIESYDVYDFSDKTVEEKDERGNVIRKVDEAGNVTTYTYNNNNVKLSENTVDSDGNTIYSATYNALGDIISEENNGETTAYTYTDGKLSQTVFTDSEKNVTTTDYVNGIISSVVTRTKDNIITYSASYDSYGSIISITEDGETVTYTYDRDDFGNITSESSSDGTTVTYTYSYFDDDNDGTDDRFEFVSYHSTDSDGVTRYYDKEDRLIREEKSGEVISSYTYDNDGNLTSKTENGKTISYSYTDDKLTSVTRNGNSYNYSYDVWGNKESVQIGNQTLVSYSYKPNNGVLSQKTYGNGSTEKYSYNAYGQVSSISKTGLGSYTFNYDSKGTLVYTRDNVGNFRTYYKYDAQGRSIGEHVVLTADSNGDSLSNAYANDLYNTTISYNEDGKVSQNSISSVNNTIKNNYAYSTTEDGNEQAVSTFTSVRGVTSVYDDELRITTRTISTSTPYVQSYTYNDDGYVAEEISGNATFSYTYDDDGRITEIKKNGELRQSYVYDGEGQLIRDNNLDTNCTIKYNYDGYGNITSKVTYPYTTGTVGTATSTVSYTYDSTWKDKLTSYNGESMAYDAIGNPTSYRGATTTWFGRQMQSYAKGSNSITYKYDGNGLRTSKTVNGVQHDYYYVDSVLMYEKVGNDYELFYRYDNDGKLSMIVRYNFSNSTNYYYNIVTNTQGDVVKILSGSGSVLVEYTYDAWGNIVSIKNGSGTEITSSSNIGLQNSIRYRGYVYDNETGLYYLQSRYYDPVVGRFINCDDVDYIGANDTPTGWNGFSYCENDPVNNNDLTGCSLSSILNSLRSILSVFTRKNEVTAISCPENTWIESTKIMMEEFRIQFGLKKAILKFPNSSTFLDTWNAAKSKYMIIHTHGSANGLFIEVSGKEEQEELFSVDRMSAMKRNYNIMCIFMTACQTAANNGKKDNFACAISKKINPNGIVIASKYVVSGYTTSFTSRNDKGQGGWVIYRNGVVVKSLYSDVLSIFFLYQILKGNGYI